MGVNNPTPGEPDKEIDNIFRNCPYKCSHAHIVDGEYIPEEAKSALLKWRDDAVNKGRLDEALKAWNHRLHENRQRIDELKRLTKADPQQKEMV